MISQKSLEHDHLLNVPITSAILRVSIPVIASQFAIIAFELVEIYCIGKIDKNAVAGAGEAAFLTWSLYALFQLSSIPTNTLVAQSVGKRDINGAIKFAWRGIEIGTFVSILLMLISFLFYKDIILLFKLDPPVQKATEDYLSWVLAFLPVLSLFEITRQILNAHGDTKTNMFVFWGALTMNMILNPVFIFIFKLGVKGAAIAYVTSYSLGLTVLFILLFRKGYLTRLKTYRAFDWNEYKAFLKIGAPIGFTNWIFSGVYPVLTSFLDTNAIAALPISHRIESVAYFTITGFSTATQILVAQHVGAGLIQRAEKIAYKALWLGSMVIFLISMVFFFFPSIIVSIFIKDHEVIFEGASYLRIIGVFEVFLTWELVIEGAFSGVGQTLPAMLIALPLTVMRIPLGYFLKEYAGLGAGGVWLAISFSTFLKGLCLTFWFRLGRWKKLYSK